MSATLNIICSYPFNLFNPRSTGQLENFRPVRSVTHWVICVPLVLMRIRLYSSKSFLNEEIIKHNFALDALPSFIMLHAV